VKEAPDEAVLFELKATAWSVLATHWEWQWDGMERRVGAFYTLQTADATASEDLRPGPLDSCLERRWVGIGGWVCAEPMEV